MSALDDLFTPDPTNLPEKKTGDQTSNAWYSPLAQFMAQTKLETINSITPQNAPLPGAIPQNTKAQEAMTQAVFADGHAAYNKDPVAANAWDTLTQQKHTEENRISQQAQIYPPGGDVPTRTLADIGTERAYHSIEDTATANALDYVYNSQKPHRRDD